MYLVDTSAWIHALRPDGDPEVAALVRRLLESGEAAWCPLVRLELWNGARGNRERRVLRDMERNLPELPIGPEVWEAAVEIAAKARDKGETIPATDVVIAACAHVHGARIAHADKHYERLQSLIPGR